MYQGSERKLAERVCSTTPTLIPEPGNTGVGSVYSDCAVCQITPDAPRQG